MKKEQLYVYTGENGTITTPVYFDNIPCVKKVRLIADDGKILTNGTIKTHTIVIGESQIDLWQEVEHKGQE